MKFHLRNIYRKLGSRVGTEAMRYAYEHDLASIWFMKVCADQMNGGV